jgi:hypothetical protein
MSRRLKSSLYPKSKIIFFARKRNFSTKKWQKNPADNNRRDMYQIQPKSGEVCFETLKGIVNRIFIAVVDIATFTFAEGY